MGIIRQRVQLDLIIFRCEGISGTPAYPVYIPEPVNAIFRQGFPTPVHRLYRFGLHVLPNPAVADSSG
ncbi:hypothetical protein D3C74_433300 [compost metagenome]